MNCCLQTYTTHQFTYFIYYLKIFVSCIHMNCCLQTYTTHQFTYLIYYLFQDKFKNPKLMKIQQVHQKLSRKHD